MFPMLLATLSLAHGAFVAEVNVPEGAFVGRRGATTVTVATMQLPSDLATKEGDRRCVVTFLAGADGAVVPEVGLCAKGAKEAVEEAMGRWAFTVDGPVAEGDRLLEVWLRFGRELTDLPLVFLRQDADTVWTLDVDGVEPLPWRVARAAFAAYPEAARSLDTQDSSCRVRTEIAIGGAPVVEAVEDCDEVFHDAARSAIAKHRFHAPEAADQAMRSAVDPSVDFELVMEGGEVVPRATVRFPEVVAGHERARLEEVRPQVLKLPSGPPLLRFDDGAYAEVKVYGMTWPRPEPAEVDQGCSLVFEVNSRGEVRSHVERCDAPGLAESYALAASRWRLAPGASEKGERFARFKGDMIIGADGAPYLRVESGIVQEVHPDAEAFLRTYARAETRRRVPPKVPDDLPADVPRGKAVCEVSLVVLPSGRADVDTVEGCHEALVPYAEKAIAKWRWDAAETDGRRIPTPATVRLAFHVP